MIANRKYQVLWSIFQDFGLLNLSLLVTYLLLGRWLGPNTFPLSAYLLTSTVGSITICLLGLALTDGERSAPRDFPSEIDDVARALLVGVAALIVSLYLVFGLRLEPGIVGLILSVSVLSLLASRLILNPTGESGQRKLLIVGVNATGLAIAELLENHPGAGYHLVGMVEERPGEAASLPFPVPIVGQLRSMARTLNVLGVSDVIVTRPMHQEVLRDVLPHKVRIMDTAAFYETVAGKLPVKLIPAGQFAEVLCYRHSPWHEAAVRLFDILAALVGLPFVALVSLFIVPLIRWESPGPALYSQDRVGRNGKVFKIFKFRSMVLDAEKQGAVWAQENDPRVTRIGKFIRLTRIDELPQFLNVLRGDMSLIGPRPERPEFVAELGEQLPYFYYRHLVKPGITGWAQVQYGYGSSLYDSLEKLQYDLYYLKHRNNPLLDLQILFKTVSVIVSRRGAR